LSLFCAAYARLLKAPLASPALRADRARFPRLGPSLAASAQRSVRTQLLRLCCTEFGLSEPLTASLLCPPRRSLTGFKAISRLLVKFLLQLPCAPALRPSSSDAQQQPPPAALPSPDHCLGPACSRDQECVYAPVAQCTAEFSSVLIEPQSFSSTHVWADIAWGPDFQLSAPSIHSLLLCSSCFNRPLELAFVTLRRPKSEPDSPSCCA
jgi:hypothetical protein